MSDAISVALGFEKSEVGRLLVHAENATEHLPHYGEPAKGPALWLVGDKGIYLMSNGIPALMANGELDSTGGGEGRRFVSYASGCSPDDDPDHWLALHNAICGGDDFVILVDNLANLRDVTEKADDFVVIVTDGDACQAYTESEFAQAHPEPD